MKLGAWLKLNRITAREFSETLGVSKGGVQKWVSGERVPRPRYLLLIKEETNGEVEPSDFFA